MNINMQLFGAMIFCIHKRGIGIGQRGIDICLKVASMHDKKKDVEIGETYAIITKNFNASLGTAHKIIDVLIRLRVIEKRNNMFYINKTISIDNDCKERERDG